MYSVSTKNTFLHVDDEEEDQAGLAKEVRSSTAQLKSYVRGVACFLVCTLTHLY